MGSSLILRYKSTADHRAFISLRDRNLRFLSSANTLNQDQPRLEALAGGLCQTKRSVGEITFDRAVLPQSRHNVPISGT